MSSIPWKFDVQTSYKPLNYVLGLIIVVNIKFPPATYHMIMPSTEELCCLNRAIFIDIIIYSSKVCNFT